MPRVKRRRLEARLALPAKGESQKERRLIERADEAVREARRLMKAAVGDDAIDRNPRLRKAAKRSVRRLSRAVTATDDITALWIDEVEQPE